MKLNIKELLDFFDDKKDSQKGDASALIAMLGEDLNASVYKDCRKNKVEILKESISQGSKKEKRLDRWILDKKNKKLFQCEIKNWAATAIGGKRLKSNANDEETKKVVEYYWNREMSNNFSSKGNHPNGVTKVLLTMRRLEKYKKLKNEPLLIYWMPISSDKKGLNPSSILPVKHLHSSINTNFSKLHIFSVSLYLRQLYKKGKGRKFIDLDMPHFERRIKILTKFQNKKYGK